MTIMLRFFDTLQIAADRGYLSFYFIYLFFLSVISCCFTQLVEQGRTPNLSASWHPVFSCAELQGFDKNRCVSLFFFPRVYSYLSMF